MECSHDGLARQLPQIKDTEERSTWELLKKKITDMRRGMS